MLILASHVLGFLSLLVGAIYDLKTTEVPDLVAIIGITGGIGLHAVHAYLTSSFEPLMWSLGVGTVFFVYGWAMYYSGMWGGADALAMGVLGFAAPYGLQAQNIIYPVNMFVNLMLVGFIYTIGFALYKARTGGVLTGAINKILENEKRVSLEIVAAAVLSAFAAIYLNVNGPLYFAIFLSLIFLYRFLSVLEDSKMMKKVSISQLEPGDVIEQDDVEINQVREKNFVGFALEKLGSAVGENLVGRYVSDLQIRYGYSQIVGVTEDEIEKLEDSDVEEVEVKTGVRFIPVFPVALLVTDIVGGGIYLLTALIS